MTTRRSVELVIAGQTQADAVGAVEGYLGRHGGTVMNFDYLERSPNLITNAVVKATRSPWMGSRISNSQRDWFVDRAASAPWTAVPEEAKLIEADPVGNPASYDVAVDLYRHFFDARPRNVGVAKISKVLHLMRPHLIPILDSRLIRRYSGSAKAAAKVVCAVRPDITARYLYWEAIRRDLERNATAIATLRSVLLVSSHDQVAEAGRRLSDVRLLDICTWTLGQN